jgi:hypothetical protein
MINILLSMAKPTRLEGTLIVYNSKEKEYKYLIETTEYTDDIVSSCHTEIIALLVDRGIETINELTQINSENNNTRILWIDA